MRVFKNIEGVNVNVVEHTLSILKEDPTVEIHIGTDSQVIGNGVSYSTVIAYRYNRRGVHYVATKNKIVGHMDLWNRLFKEASDSIEVAEWLTKKINVNVEIDMDYNDDESHKSNRLISAAKGWANSLGYKVNVKPNNQIATKAADHHCR
jgi:predicted RNase H-related nuclease YkuK (DUF458 family)